MAKQSPEERALKTVRRLVRRFRPASVAYHKRLQENEQFYSELCDGGEYSDEMKKALGDRPAFQFADISKGIRKLAGTEYTGRIQPEAEGREGADDVPSQIADTFIAYDREQGDADTEESESFLDQMIGGLGCIQLQTEVRDSPYPKNSWHSIDMLEMLYDERAKKLGLVDREGHVRGRELPVSQIRDLWPTPEMTKRIDRAIKNSKAAVTSDDAIGVVGTWGVKSSGWTWYEDKDATGGRVSPYNETSETAFLVEAEWKEVKTFYLVELVPEEAAAFFPGMVEIPVPELVLDPLAPPPPPPPPIVTGDATFLPEEGVIRVKLTRGLFDEFMETYEATMGVAFEEWLAVPFDEIHYAILFGDEVLETGVRKEGFTYLWLNCYRSRRKDGGWEWFGLIDVMRVPQVYTNRMLSLGIEAVASQIKYALGVDTTLLDAQGYEHAVVQRLAEIGTIVPTKGNPASAIHEFGGKSLPPGVIEMMQMAKREILGALGESDYSVGGGGDLRRVASTTLEAVQSGGALITARPFEALRYLRKATARLQLRKMAQWPAKALRKIVGPDLGRYVPDNVAELDLSEVNIIISERPTTPGAQKARWAELNTLMPMLQGNPATAFDKAALAEMLPTGMLTPRAKELWLQGGAPDRITALEQQVQQIMQMLQPEQGGAPPPEQPQA